MFTFCFTSRWLFFQIFERILFIWAIRHPASGYVQGMNDLVIPFFVVFLCEHTGTTAASSRPWPDDGAGCDETSAEKCRSGANDTC